MDSSAITRIVRDLLEAGSWIASIIASVFAALIFIEARAIRHVEWFSKSSTNWQDFTRLILETDSADRWSMIKQGRVAWRDMTERDRFLVYGFLNVLVYEHQLYRHRVLRRGYAIKSIFDNVLYFNPIWDELEAHLRVDGWPIEFVEEARRHILKTRAAALS
ncbi:hypothetical protein BH10PSE4_BH10PSE4_17850 [soil metagenome]